MNKIIFATALLGLIQLVLLILIYDLVARRYGDIKKIVRREHLYSTFIALHECRRYCVQRHNTQMEEWLKKQIGDLYKQMKDEYDTNK